MRSWMWGVVLWALVAGGQAAADWDAVEVAQLAPYGALAADLEYLRENRSRFDHWEAQWSHPVSRESCLDRLRAISGRAAGLSAAQGAPIDLVLLELVVLQYRYNLEDPGTAGEFLTKVKAAQEVFPQDYRPLWLEAVFLAHAARAPEAVAAFQRLVPRAERLGAVHPTVLLNYAHACSFAGMPRTALICLTAYAQAVGASRDELPLVGAVAPLLTPADPQAGYPAAEVWTSAPEGELVRYFSQSLGTSFAVPAAWQVRPGDYQGGQAVTVITPPALRSSLGKSITISLALVHSTRGGSLEAFAGALRTQIEPAYTLSALPARSLLGAGLGYTVTNPRLYADRGGMRGSLRFFANPFTPTSGFNLDLPSSLPATSEAGYYRWNPRLDRMPAPVYSFLMVDSCQELAQETDALAAAFLKTLRVW